jgi:hypothetical protein
LAARPAGFIDTEAEMVTIVLVGEKRGDALIVRGEEFRSVGCVESSTTHRVASETRFRGLD